MTDLVVPEGLNFETLKWVEVPVPIDHQWYILKEAPGGAVNEFRNAQTDGMIFGSDGKPRQVHGLHDTAPLLVSKCLYRAEVGEDGKPLRDDEGKFKTGTRIGVPIITAWPWCVQDGLFEEVKRISGIEEEEETKEALEKQLAEIQERLDQIEADAAEDSAKNDETPVTMHGSE